MTFTRTVGKSRNKFRYKKRPARKAVDRRQNKNISKLYRMVKYSKERKYIDQEVLNLTLGSSWVNPLPRDLTFIASGSGENQRVGNKIKIHSHHLKFVMTCGDSTQLYRILVVRFSHESASLVALSDALENPAGTTPSQILSFKKRNTDSKYQILWDSKTQRLAGNGPASAPIGVITQRVHDVKLNNGSKGWYTGYNSPSASACVAGFTYVVVCTDSAIAPSPSITCLSRTIFSG